jgi:anti-sigma B factor antagonist
MSPQQLTFALTRTTDRDHDPELTVTVQRAGPLTEVDATGIIDLTTADLLTAAVDHMISTYAPLWLILDLADVRLLSAAGITALLQAQTAVTGQGGRLLLRNPSPMTCKVLDITDSARLFSLLTAPRTTTTGPEPRPERPLPQRYRHPTGGRTT